MIDYDAVITGVARATESFERGNIRAMVIYDPTHPQDSTLSPWAVAIETDEGTTLIDVRDETEALAIYRALFNGATGA